VKGLWRASGGPLEGLWWASGGSLVGLWWASGGPLVGLWWVSGGPLVGLWWASGGPLEGLWWASGSRAPLQREASEAPALRRPVQVSSWWPGAEGRTEEEEVETPPLLLLWSVLPLSSG